MNTANPTVLFADADDSRLPPLMKTLEQKGYRVLLSHKAHETLCYLDKHVINVAILNTVLADMKGVGLIPIIRKQYPDVKLIVTAEKEMHNHERYARPWGIVTFLIKPLDMKMMEEIIIFAAEGKCEQIRRTEPLRGGT